MAELPPPPPGIVIHHQPAASGCYVGSPSLAVMPDGRYVASCDLFGPKTERGNKVTLVFGSRDRGQSWQPIALVQRQFWSNLFFHRGGLYLFGTSGENGHLSIRRSGDGGRIWTDAVDNHSGLLTPDDRWHTAPVPIVEHRGRLWRGVEDQRGPGGWGTHFRAHVISAPAESDLLEASNWTISEPLGRDPSWLNGAFGGWLEGNAVVAPDDEVVNLLRCHVQQVPERAALQRVSADGTRLAFDPNTDFVLLPGGAKKFTVRPDPQGAGYWTLANVVLPEFEGLPADTVRNTVALLHSDDLRSWTQRAVVLSHPDPVKHGWQYLDWQFDGDDLVAASRTAYDDLLGGAPRQHDANYLTFHRLVDFRHLGVSRAP